MITAKDSCRHTHLNPARVNDVHSGLNRTEVAAIARVNDVAEVIAGLELARRHDLPVAVCGGRHAMGGQQFASGGVLLDMSGMNRVLEFDSDSGLIEVEAGLQWPKLLKLYLALQSGRRRQWGLRQKQTGADRLSIGGAVAANIHGRVLTAPPLVEDIVALRLIDAKGQLRQCSRVQNPDLFRLVIGGYGLFGVVVSVTMQLVPRRKLQRVVTLLDVAELIDAFADRIQQGYLYGDLQFKTDSASADFLQSGVFSCYRPVAHDAPIPASQLYMTEAGWQHLLYLAHVDKSRAFDQFAQFYQSTSGQIYWSDQHQFTTYLDDYHERLDPRLCARQQGSEMITELYVPPNQLGEFIGETQDILRSRDADLIYGTIRLIRTDSESYLAWAKQDYACVIFNLHVAHTSDTVATNDTTMRLLATAALNRGGSFFLTYHRAATRDQVDLAYPRFADFLREKRRRDPGGVFVSDWYRHYDGLYGDLHSLP